MITGNSRFFAATGCLCVLAFFSLPPASAAEICHLNSPSGYQKMGGGGRLGPYSSRSQCDSVNTGYFHGRGSCSCTSTPSPSYSYGTNPYQALFNNLFSPMGEAIGRNMECLFNPDCGANAEQEQQKQMLLHNQRQEEQRQKEAAEERQREFDRKKADLLNQMRGLPELRLKETADVFGTKSLKPRDLTSTQTASLGSRPTTALQKAHCTAYLLRKAGEAASQDRLEESAFLSNEAADLMSGAKASPAVVCPAPPEVPGVRGGPVPATGEQAERLRKAAFVYSRLTSQAARQLGDYREVLERFQTAEEKMETARERKEEAKDKVERFQREVQKPESGAGNNMAEALAALRQAEALLQESEKELAEAQREKEDREAKMNQTRDLFLQARDRPEKIDDVYRQLRTSSETGEEK